MKFFHKHYAFLELDCGRGINNNPRLIQSLTVYRLFDDTVNEYWPLVSSSIQLFDPFGELKFHKSQNNQLKLVP